MKFLYIYITTILFTLSLLVAGSFYFIIGDLKEIIWDLQKALEDCDSKIPQHQLIANNLLEEEIYRLDFYDCSEFSEELSSRLDDAGYNTKECIGWLKAKNDTQLYPILKKHRWIRLELNIESTTGKIIEPVDYFERYELIRCD